MSDFQSPKFVTIPNIMSLSEGGDSDTYYHVKDTGYVIVWNPAIAEFYHLSGDMGKEVIDKFKIRESLGDICE